MANQDTLHQMWLSSNLSRTSVTIRKIGSFANTKRHYLNSRTDLGITSSGLDYAVLKFILEYTMPVNWPQGLWTEFDYAKDPHTGNYGIWKKYPDLLVDIRSSGGYFTKLENRYDSKGIKDSTPKTPVHSLSVSSVPSGATIIIDDMDRGKTPNVIQDLSEGEHSIECTLGGCQNQVKKIHIPDKRSIHFDLIKNPIRIQNITPPDENVTKSSSLKGGLAIIVGLFVIVLLLVSITVFSPPKSQVNQPVVPALPTTCVGDCHIGQTATDGYFNNQEFSVNRVFYLNRPYYDPELDFEPWYSGDWILLDISLTNLDKKSRMLFGELTLTDGFWGKYYCFDSQDLELTDFKGYIDIKPGETRRGNISCAIEPGRARPSKLEYDFKNSYLHDHENKRRNAIYEIDSFIPLDYNSIKSTLKGNKPS